MLLTDLDHRNRLLDSALAQFAFFRSSLRPAGGFHLLEHDGSPQPTSQQELHATARMVHSYALGQLVGAEGAADMVDHGMSFLWNKHRDAKHGGYCRGVTDDDVPDDRKLAYGHSFVLLAAASAKLVHHPDADRLLQDVWEVMDTRFWEDGYGLFSDEFNRDWTSFSTYRGMGSNMHTAEALMAVYEVTGDTLFLDRAGRILDFFVQKIAPDYGWRLPEHFKDTWQPDPAYAGDPMFRPAGTIPGHSFELARLQIQHWDLKGRPNGVEYSYARNLVDRALEQAWHTESGGFIYTVGFDGTWDNTARFWWPVTEAIGALSVFLKLAPSKEDAVWYEKLWAFSEAHLIDKKYGGWFPELDATNQPAAAQFSGKPDLYHAIQAELYPLVPRVSGIADGLVDLKGQKSDI